VSVYTKKTEFITSSLIIDGFKLIVGPESASLWTVRLIALNTFALVVFSRLQLIQE
jgi:hypothetical protein